jgi:hypothetical protein
VVVFSKIIVRLSATKGASMSSPQRKYRSFQYRRAVYVNGTTGLDLQALLTQAYENLQDVESREETVVIGGMIRVVSQPATVLGMTKGLFLQYTPGQRKQFLERDQSGRDYVIGATDPPEEEVARAAADAGKKEAADEPQKVDKQVLKKRREFVDHIVYFAVQNNHVVFVGGRRGSSSELESHVNWLLAKAGLINPAEEFVALTDELPADVLFEQEGFKGEPTSIVIGAPIDFTELPHDEDAARTKSGKKTVSPDERSANLLETIFPSWKASPVTLPVGRSERIEVQMVIKYTSHAKSADGFEMMRSLAVAARHFDDNEAVIHLKDGGSVKGKTLRISENMQVEVGGDTDLIVEYVLWRKVHQWLYDLISKRLILPK